jgi:PKD repeat protein
VSAASYNINTITFGPGGPLTASAGNPVSGASGLGKSATELIDDAWTNQTGGNVDVIYNVSPVSSAGCVGQPFTVTATIQPKPATLSNVTTTSICSDVVTGYSLSVAGAATYNISTNSNGLVQSSGTVSAGTGKFAAELADDSWTNINSGFASINVVYTVTPVSSTGCLGVTFTVTIPVTPEPRGFNDVKTICSNSGTLGYDLQASNINVTASGGNSLVSTFQWAAANNTNVTGETSSTQTSTVIGDNLINTTGVNQVVVYTITPTGSVDGCLGDNFTLTVTVKPEPVGVNDTKTVCSDVQVNYNLINNVAILGNNVGSTFSWVANSNSNVTGESLTPKTGSTITDVITNVTNLSQIVTYNITPTAVNGCVGSVFQISVTVNPEPVGISKPTTICSGLSVSYDLQANVNSFGNILPTNFSWVAASNANVSGESLLAHSGSIIDDVLTNSTNSPQVVTYTATPSAQGTGCPGSTFTISVTVNPDAKISALPNLAQCEDQASIALGGSINYAPNGVAWSGGLGSYSNINDPNATYSFNNPSEINTTVALTLTALDPDGAGGPCGPVSVHTNLKINPLPSANFVGFTRPTYVQNDQPIQLNAFQKGGSFTISPATSSIGATTQTPFDQAILGNFNTATEITPPNPDLSNLTVGSNTITYTFTDANGCTNSTSQSITLNPVTSVKFTVQSGFLNPSFIWEICANQFNSYVPANPSPSLIKLIGNPPASTGLTPGTSFTASNGVNNSANVMSIVYIAPDYYIETSGLPVDSYDVTYHYVNSFGAATFVTSRIFVHAGPVAQISVANNCISSAIQFNDASPPTPTDPIVFWKWDFNDGSAPVFAQNPSHTYGTPNIYKVILQVATSFGCNDTTSTKVRVGAVPLVKYGASSICNNDSTKFKDLTTNPNNISRITTYTWDFGDGTTLVGDSATLAAANPPVAWNKGNVYVSPGGTFKDPFHQYATFGTYHPKLTVNTNDGCVNSYQRSIFILPYKTFIATSTNAYTEDFEASDGGYQVEAKNPLDSSWIWTVPNGKVINGTSKAWWTGLFNGTYDSAESSVVNGPCFNLSSLTRPMISFDFWVNTPVNNNDGAVLQYSVNGGIDWFNVGVPGQGNNWYSSKLIVNNPGDQPIGYGPYGWSGNDQKAWMKGSFNLDGLPQGTKRNQVRIRFAFAGDSTKNIPSQGRYNGFAFDNIFVGNKVRNVLVEEFTNATVPSSLTADQYFQTTLYAQDSLNRGGYTDFNALQYHVRFPAPDVFAQGNTNDVAARALYYGVQQPPYAVMDGMSPDKLTTTTQPPNDYHNINLIEIDRRALRTPPLTITQIDTTSTSPTNHSFNVKVSIRADTAITYPLYAQVALVESPVFVSNVRYTNVVRQLLYGGDGVTKSTVMAKNDVQTFTQGDVQLTGQVADPTKLYLVAFIQRFDLNNKEMLQSVMMPVIKKVGSLVTGIESSVAELEQVQIYPNPANGKFYFSTSGEYPSNCIWKISDQRGINVMAGNFNDAVKGVKAVDISSLTNGVYFVAIGAPDQNPVYMKLVVLNSN